MKSVTLIEYRGRSNLGSKVRKWLFDNNEDILEVHKIEYERHDNTYLATITYKPNKDKNKI